MENPFQTKMINSIWFYVFAASLGPFNFGWHLSELNTPKKYLQCQSTEQKDCMNMSDTMFSFITAAFTIGGLLGSLLGSFLKQGRRPQLLLSAIFTVAGSLFKSTNMYVAMLIIGRLLVGIGSGLALLNAPIYVNEISPLNKRGVYGTMILISVTIGISVASLCGYLGLYWQYLLGIPVITGTLQFIAMYFSPESLNYTEIHTESIIDSKDNSARHSDVPNWHTPVIDPTNQTFLKFIKNKLFIRLLVVVMIAQSCLQLSGINAIFFYSSTILESLFGDKAPLFSFLITLFNFITAFLPGVLAERAGRRKTLISSILLTGIAQFRVMLSLLFNSPISSFIFILLVILSFQLGLGILPYTIIGELFDDSVVNYANVLANSINWISNFIVSFGFIPLTALAGPYVFIFFIVYCFMSGTILYVLMPETKDKSPLDILAALNQSSQHNE